MLEIKSRQLTWVGPKLPKAVKSTCPQFTNFKAFDGFEHNRETRSGWEVHLFCVFQNQGKEIFGLSF